MKGLTHIIYLVVFLCAISPCADEFVDSGNEGQATVEVQEDGDHHQHGEDSCSPFCSCHCCHKHSLVEEVSVEEEGFFVRLFSEPLITPPEEPLFEDPHPPRSQHSLA